MANGKGMSVFMMIVVAIVFLGAGFGVGFALFDKRKEVTQLAADLKKAQDDAAAQSTQTRADFDKRMKDAEASAQATLAAKDHQMEVLRTESTAKAAQDQADFEKQLNAVRAEAQAKVEARERAMAALEGEGQAKIAAKDREMAGLKDAYKKAQAAIDEFNARTKALTDAMNKEKQETAVKLAEEQDRRKAQIQSLTGRLAWEGESRLVGNGGAERVELPNATLASFNGKAGDRLVWEARMVDPPAAGATDTMTFRLIKGPPLALGQKIRETPYNSGVQMEYKDEFELAEDGTYTLKWTNTNKSGGIKFHYSARLVPKLSE